VLEAALRGEIEPVASWELIEEIVAVLRRPRLRRYEIAEDDVEELLILLAPFLPSVDVEPPIRDPGDAPVVAAALAGGAEAIVTGDHDFLEDDDLGRWLGERGVRVVRPAALIELLAR
jgi:putative PIN family toxin of toxin-antitoxin system